MEPTSSLQSDRDEVALPAPVVDSVRRKVHMLAPFVCCGFRDKDRGSRGRRPLTQLVATGCAGSPGRVRRCGPAGTRDEDPGGPGSRGWGEPVSELHPNHGLIAPTFGPPGSSNQL